MPKIEIEISNDLMAKLERVRNGTPLLHASPFASERIALSLLHRGTGGTALRHGRQPGAYSGVQGELNAAAASGATRADIEALVLAAVVAGRVSLTTGASMISRAMKSILAPPAPEEARDGTP